MITTGLADDEIVLDADGKLVSDEVCFRKDSQRCIINMDETHHNSPITGDRGGSRAVSYHNPAFQRGAMRGVKSGRHITGVYATNAKGKASLPFYISESTAKTDENFRVKMDWLVGLPSIEGRFGCPTCIESDSFFAVRSRGSMDEELLNHYIESVIIPLYPNMHMTAVFDTRIVSSEIVLAKREEFVERGLIIIMGLPNAASVQQEMDALYGPFKTATYSCGEKVLKQKMKERSSAVLNLDFSDLPTMVNGTAADAIADKPIDLHFNKEKILWLWAKIGFVPFTRSCLKNKRVREERGQHTRDEALEDIQFLYDVLVNEVEGQGFNPGVFYASIPVATHVERAETEAEQVEQVLKSGKAFSASGH